MVRVRVRARARARIRAVALAVRVDCRPSVDPTKWLHDGARVIPR
jgi:hypothetical protein